MALSSSSSYSLENVEIYYSGQDRGQGIRGLTIQQGDAELTNFANIASTGTPLYCIIERYDSHPDYIRAFIMKTTTTTTTTIATTAPKVKNFKDYLNDILYSKLVQLEVIMQWYLDASKKQQRILDEADFINQVVSANEILEVANAQVMNGTVRNIDLLGV